MVIFLVIFRDTNATFLVIRTNRPTSKRKDMTHLQVQRLCLVLPKQRINCRFERDLHLHYYPANRSLIFHRQGQLFWKYLTSICICFKITLAISWSHTAASSKQTGPSLTTNNLLPDCIAAVIVLQAPAYELRTSPREGQYEEKRFISSETFFSLKPIMLSDLLFSKWFSVRGTLPYNAFFLSRCSE